MQYYRIDRKIDKPFPDINEIHVQLEAITVAKPDHILTFYEKNLTYLGDTHIQFQWFHPELKKLMPKMTIANFLIDYG